MSYQVLARKWRPRTFSELVGQEHVVRALSNALDNDRLHHAYLFTGTRGVGKTTLARILAKSLNCEQGVSSTPCGECATCREVDEGRFADLLEVDAASRTKVDQTRELLENVPYAPIRGRYKVYLIDEVHMFSDSSFNALLKTLEEPPPHVKFLLATTDPQKVPVTVLSRCLQMNLTRLPVESIEAQFEHILQAEGVSYEPAALSFLARVADGSMRDGLSILDQGIAYGGGSVQEADVMAMLGAVATDRLPGLLELVAENNASGVLSQVEQLAQQTPDFAGLLKDLILMLHRVAVLQSVPEAGDVSWGNLDLLGKLAQKFSPEDTQLYYEIALRGRRDLHLAADSRSGFEMTLLRMLAFYPAAPGTNQAAPVESGSRPAPKAAQNAASRQEKQPQPQGTASLAKKREAATSSAAMNTGNGDQSELGDWHQLLPRLNLGGMSEQLAAHCSVGAWDDNKLTLNLDPACSGLVGSLAEERLKLALDKYFGKPITLNIELIDTKEDTPARRAEQERCQREADALANMQQDPLVNALEERFEAELIVDSVKAVDNDKK